MHPPRKIPEHMDLTECFSFQAESVVIGHVMPPELSPSGPSGPSAHPAHGPTHAPIYPPCGPGPSYAGPGAFLLSVESAKDLYDLVPRARKSFRIAGVSGTCPKHHGRTSAYFLRKVELGLLGPFGSY